MPSALLVVTNPTTPDARDQSLADFLRTALGFSVTFHLETSQPSFAGHDLVVISESCNSGNLATYAADYRGTTLPLICFENALWDELNFGTGHGTETGATALDIVDAASQVAAGYSTGDVTYLTSSIDQKYLVGAATGVNVVAQTPVGHHPLVFTIESGADLTTGTAASRRVGVGFLADVWDQTNRYMTEVGYDILSEAVRWAMGESVAKTQAALLVVGISEPLQESEQFVHQRLRSLGFTVAKVTDSSLTTVQANGYDLVVMSKTVVSTNVGDALKATTAPVIFWEDNQQQLSMMATVDNSSVTGTAWHNPETRLTMAASPPANLDGGLTGTFDFYRVSGEITYAPKTDGGAQTLGSGAQRIAEYGAGTQDWWSVYVFDRGATLADSTAAAGKRGYFGLYDDTFRLLTADGVALFDDMVNWSTSTDAVEMPEWRVSREGSTSWHPAELYSDWGV